MLLGLNLEILVLKFSLRHENRGIASFTYKRIPYAPIWQEYAMKEKFTGLLPRTLPHPEGWQTPPECDPAYLSDELYCVHGFE